MTSSISSKRGFTLVELLTVIAIIGVLLVLALPAFTTLGKASKVASGIRQISNALNLARQYAITKRTNTRVVFPYSATSGQPDMWYRSFSVVASNRNASGAVAWEYISKWEYLPDGVIFGTSGVSSGSVDTLRSEAIPFPATSNSTATLAYFQFGPTGAGLSTTEAERRLCVGEGISAGASTWWNPSNSVNLVRVGNLVGRVTVTRP